jgi:polyhydroxyalkanoate synthesis repressor PhaR
MLRSKCIAAMAQMLLSGPVRPGGDAGPRRQHGRPMATTTKEPVVIKKYANRRLYNTGSSTYVTLEDLAAMIRNGEDFVVRDAKSGEDITRAVLTQIIVEQEGKGQNLLPIKFLRQII